MASEGSPSPCSFACPACAPSCYVTGRRFYKLWRAGSYVPRSWSLRGSAFGSWRRGVGFGAELPVEALDFAYRVGLLSAGLSCAGPRGRSSEERVAAICAFVPGNEDI